jgi:hypothetical protein
VSLRLHAVIRAAHRLPDGSSFRLVALEDVAVVVSEHPDGRVLTEQEAVDDLAGLCALVPDGPVVPLRIGTTAVDETAARAAVHALSVPVVRDRLNQLDGVAEMHVRLVFDEDTALRAIHDESGFTGSGADLAATVAQGERIARQIVAWRRNQADGMLAPASAVALAVALLDPPAHTEEHRAFLVPLGKVETVRDVVAALNGVTATCTGPLPAFHFLDLAPRHPRHQGERASRWGW